MSSFVQVKVIPVTKSVTKCSKYVQLFKWWIIAMELCLDKNQTVYQGKFAKTHATNLLGNSISVLHNYVH